MKHKKYDKGNEYSVSCYVKFCVNQKFFLCQYNGLTITIFQINISSGVQTEMIICNQLSLKRQYMCAYLFMSIVFTKGM